MSIVLNGTEREKEIAFRVPGHCHTYNGINDRAKKGELVMTVTDGDLVDNAQIVRCVESLDHVRPGNRPDKLTRVN